MVAITGVPEAPAWLPGVINVRGRVVPVIDLRLRLGLPFQASGLSTPIILVQIGDQAVGMIVDQTAEVLNLPPDVITPPDELTKNSKPIQSIALQDGQLILILDLARVTVGIEKFCVGGRSEERYEIVQTEK